MPVLQQDSQRCGVRGMKLGYARVSTTDQDLAMEGRRAAQAAPGVPFGRPPKLRPDQRTLGRRRARVPWVRRDRPLRASAYLRAYPRRDRPRPGNADESRAGRRWIRTRFWRAGKLIEAGMSPARAAKLLGIDRATACRIAAAVREGQCAPSSPAKNGTLSSGTPPWPPPSSTASYTAPAKST